MRAFRSHALLLRSVAYGESDLIVTLLTETDGKLGARLRGGRKSSRRASGGIEPFHMLEVALDDRGGDLLSLKETAIVRVRAGLVSSLEAMDAAGTALRWARFLLPTRHPEARAWSTLDTFLDRLDEPRGPSRPDHPARGLLAMAGFHLLASVGYALELQRCVICGRSCPADAPAYVDGHRGGLVCRACRGVSGGRLMGSRLRKLAMQAQVGPDEATDARLSGAWLAVPDWITSDEVDDLLGVLSDAMASHAGLDPSS